MFIVKIEGLDQCFSNCLNSGLIIYNNSFLIKQYSPSPAKNSLSRDNGTKTKKYIGFKLQNSGQLLDGIGVGVGRLESLTC